MDRCFHYDKHMLTRDQLDGWNLYRSNFQSHLQGLITLYPGDGFFTCGPAGFALKDTPVIVGVAADSGCGKWLYGDLQRGDE